MAANKPLSYLSLKCVLEHLGVDIRFHLYQKCPSIQSTEKLLPLKIDSLQLAPSELEISGARVSYRLGIICQHPNEKTPRQMRWDEMSHDVDQYGFELYNQDIAKEVGEVLIVNRENEDSRRQREVLNNNELSNWEYDLKRLEEDRKIKNTWEQTSERVLRKFDKTIEKLKAKILPYHLKKNNATSPYNHFLRLTITTRKDERVEHLAYTRKIHDAMRYLIEKLFGGRRKSIEVKKLEISRYGVLRLPTNMKLKVQTIEIMWEGSNSLNALKPIIDDESFPLKSFITDGRFSLNDPIIQNTQKLILSSFLQHHRLPELTHRRIHFRNIWRMMLLRLLRHLLEHGRMIGTCFSFSISSDKNAKNVMEDLKQVHGARIEEPRDNSRTQCVIFRMTDFSELCVYCEKQQMGIQDLWLIHEMRMEVQPIENAIPL